MKRILSLLLLLFVLTATLPAQNARRRAAAEGTKAQQTSTQRPNARHHQQSGPNFGSYLHEKCDAVVHELGLSPQDSARVIPIYHELQSEKAALFRKYGGARAVRIQLESGQPVADSTLVRINHNNAQLQVEDALLEQRFLARFQSVLTPLQIFQLQQAEQKFKTNMMRRGKSMRK